MRNAALEDLSKEHSWQGEQPVEKLWYILRT